VIQQSTHNPIKAVGLISGGLDSILAAKIVKDLGVEVHGVYFAMPWGCCDKGKAQSAAEQIGIPLIVLQLDERYLQVVKTPKYGYGSVMNPCVDCRIHMFTRAAQYMRHINAQFIFTGEIIGQRPMSQKRHSMRWIEEGARLEGRLLRPLCAQLMEPTIPEQEGLIDREKLLAISGRSRKGQLQLAEQLSITAFSAPAGGCSLTDSNFAERMKDTLKHGYRNFRETIALKWGRHFRLNPQFKAILGRDEMENKALMHYAHPQDTIMQLEDNLGPTLILKGDNPTEEILKFCAGLIQRFSRYKNETSVPVKYWIAHDQNTIKNILSVQLNETEIEKISIHNAS
jgi:tRNA U34 2-thiouridine synthase MnmA/TrmU